MNAMKHVLFSFIGVLISGAALVWWGSIAFAPKHTVTVVGEARSQKKSEIATFTAGVNAIHDDKQKAIAEVSDKGDAIIASVKEFGIKPEDIKTQNLNIYQNQETYYEEGRQKQRPGQWNVSNSIEIKLREVDRASSLADVLGKSGANNVYGPNFTLDDDPSEANSLFSDAIENAREKAETVAKSSGKKLGNVLSITEGFSSSGPVPMLRMEAGGGGGGLEPGAGTVTKSVTVVFEFK